MHRDSGLKTNDVLQRALEHVLWICGAPDSGKTSIANLLAERYSLDVYHFDRHEMAHFARADPAVTPALWAAHPDRMSVESRWLGSSPEAMARATITSWSERCRMAFEDIANMAKDSAVIAEGPGFFPSVLAPVLTSKRKAIWLVPREDFKRHTAAARGKPGNRSETTNPDLASANIIARDLLIGARIREDCLTFDLNCLQVSGSEGIGTVLRVVEDQFRCWLEGFG